MSAFSHPLLDPVRMEMLRRIRLAPHGSAEGAYAGQHPSHYRGSAVEFADFREYSPGDDIRILDWKVFARTDRYYVRQFEAERNLLTYCAIDCSGSMAFSGVNRKTHSKYQHAATIAAALAYTVVREGDEMGMTLAGGRDSAQVPLQGGWQHLSRMVDLLAEATPGGTARLGECLREMHLRAGRRGTVIVLSDFLALDEAFWNAVNLFRKARFDVIMFQIVHPEEVALPEVAMGRFVGTEGEAERFDVAPEEVAESYRAAFHRHVTGMEAHAQQRGCAWFLARTDADPYLFLKQCLLARECAP